MRWGRAKMPKSAVDPFFASNVEPISAGRRAQVVPAGTYGTDLPTVTSSLIISSTAAGNLSVIMANDQDSQITTIPIVAGMTQISIQVRQVVIVPTGATVVALWS
jgi:hypothetical protein